MKCNDVTPKMKVDPESYRVEADGVSYTFSFPAFVAGFFAEEGSMVVRWKAGCFCGAL